MKIYFHQATIFLWLKLLGLLHWVYKKNFVLVTAFSGNHFLEALRSCKSIGKLKESKNFERGYMIAYILKNDVSYIHLEQYRNECPFVTLRIFNATKYPAFVSKLLEYRWKPLIVAEVLQEVEKVFYFDSSVIFKDNANENITEILQKMDTKFEKCGIRFFGDAGHSIIRYCKK
uniref:Uncharacterized protein n=1 Tax=Panagrolaimus superbus TaxID=310955 RepID=A0A914Z524_9BILA